MACLLDELLKLVMKHVPLEDRLTSCCLVSRRMHAAAVAATEHIELYASSFGAPKQQCFLDWMSHQGQHVTSLELYDLPQPLQQLPCPNLLNLALSASSIQVGPSADGHPGVAQGCPKLTSLILGLCNIIDAPEGARAELSGLSNLVHLQCLVVSAPQDLFHYTIGGLSIATLPRLTHLRKLNVWSLSSGNFAQLGGLCKLQDIFLPGDWGGVMPILGPRSVPGLSFPASLTSLQIESRVEAGILSVVPAGLKELEVILAGPIEGPSEGPGSFLSLLAGLQQLVQLTLCFDDWPPAGPGYSALTASSALASLAISGRALPAGMWAHMFPAARKLHQLTSLESGNLSRASECPEPGYRAPGVPPFWGPSDLSALVSCCPNLCRFHGMSLQHGPHVCELKKLPSLTSGVVCYPAADMCSFVESMKGLAAVTQLRYLGIDFNSEDWTVACLLPLTCLTALTYLYFTESKELKLSICSQGGSVPDVWLQLLERCAAEPGCQPTALRNLAQQLAEQRTLVTHQQQRIALHEQQLSAQQQVAAEQGARIAALEGQLQALLQRHPL